MQRIFGSSPTLRVDIEQTTVFLHPGQDPDLPGDDQILRGAVVLNLPKAKAVSSVKARLQSSQTFTAGPQHRLGQEVCLERQVVIDLKDEVLEAGEHFYEFTFIIPANSPEYQRCNYGSTRCFVSAKVKFSGVVNTTITSTLKQLYFVGNPSPAGEVPGPFSEYLTAFHENLGPISIAITAPHLTVSSLVFFEASLPSPPAGVDVLTFKTFMTETAAIHYGPDDVVIPPPRTHVLFDASSRPCEKPSTTDDYRGMSAERDSTLRLPAVEEAQEWVYRRLARVPPDNSIRPSTIPNSLSRVKLDHAIGAEITYTKDGGPVQAITMIKKIFLTSCCCLRDDLRLPSYSQDPDHKRLEGVSFECICSSSFSQLEEDEAKGVFEYAGSPLPPLVSPEEAMQKSPAVRGDDREYFSVGQSSTSV